MSTSTLFNLTLPTKGMQVTASSALSGGVDTGDPINIAINYVPGTAHGTESDALIDAQSQVYGAAGSAFYDGTNYTETSLAANEPRGFNTPLASLSADDFASWHSAYQAEYLKAHQGSAGLGAEVDIGSDPNVIHAILSDRGDRAIILDNLQKSDFAKMAVEDQLNVAASPFFENVLATRLNLTTDATAAKDSINYLISTTIGGVPTVPVSGQNGMTVDEKQPFIDELNLIQSHLENMHIFSLQDISDQVTAISKRFDRASKFAIQQQHVGPSTQGAVSSDDNATIARGYKNMIAQETQIRDVAVAADALIRSAAVSNKKLDAPMMIFYFQLHANLSKEAQINADTEEVKQLNALLNLYSQMQGLVQQTLETFGDKSDDKRTLLGRGNVNDLPTDPPSSRIIMSVFEDVEGSGRHPLEVLYGIKKPTYDMINQSNGGLNSFLKDSWNSFNGALSNAVSQLNQQTQIIMDGINSTTKEKDRHFDLGNNALSKIADIIQTISRGLA